MLLLILGCKSSLAKKYQITDPKPENEISISKFGIGNGVNVKNDFVYIDMNAFLKVSNNNLLSVLDALFFNNNRDYVSYSRIASECNAGIESFINDS